MSHHGFTVDGGSDEWYTPPEVFEKLGMGFVMDPLLRHVAITEMYDPFPVGGTVGLLGWPKNESVWLNPPYSLIDEVVALAATRPSWLFIAWCRTDAPWAQRLVAASEAQLWLNKRVRFIDGRKKVRDKKTKEWVDNPGYMKRGGTPGAPSFIAGKGAAVRHLEHASINGHGVITKTGL